MRCVSEAFLAQRPRRSGTSVVLVYGDGAEQEAVSRLLESCDSDDAPFFIDSHGEPFTVIGDIRGRKFTLLQKVEDTTHIAWLGRAYSHAIWGNEPFHSDS